MLLPQRSGPASNGRATGPRPRTSLGGSLPRTAQAPCCRSSRSSGEPGRGAVLPRAADPFLPGAVPAVHDGRMTNIPSEQADDAALASARAPESYTWPLVALVLVILPQVLVPATMREGPPAVVPLVEGVVVLVLLAVAAKPGPVPRSARPLILSLFAVLVVANTAAAVRLVTLILRSTPKGRTPPTVTQLLIGAAIVLTTNIVTFALL